MMARNSFLDYNEGTIIHTEKLTCTFPISLRNAHTYYIMPIAYVSYIIITYNIQLNYLNIKLKKLY